MLTYTTHKLESIEKKLNMPQLENMENILPPVPLKELIQLEELENLLIINETARKQMVRKFHL